VFHPIIPVADVVQYIALPLRNFIDIPVPELNSLFDKPKSTVLNLRLKMYSGDTKPQMKLKINKI